MSRYENEALLKMHFLAQCLSQGVVDSGGLFIVIQHV